MHQRSILSGKPPLESHGELAAAGIIDDIDDPVIRNDLRCLTNNPNTLKHIKEQFGGYLARVCI